MIIIVMGVSGSGKTTTGKALANSLSWRFIDADDYHPVENVAKMASGEPLTDLDRIPWLNILRQEIEIEISQSGNMVVACSALKDIYREILAPSPEVKFVFLSGSMELIYSRMRARKSHFMKSDMLASQFEALEPPLDAVAVDISMSTSQIVEFVKQALLLT